MLKHAREYLSWHYMAREAFEKTRSGLEEGFPCERIRDSGRLVIIGVGGSAAVGDFLEAMALDYNFPIEIVTVRGPPWRGCRKGSFLLPVSYSGETSETIHFTLMALHKASGAAALTSGGTLEHLMKKRGFPVLRLEPGHTSRTMLPVMLFSLLGLLRYCDLTGDLTDQEVVESLEPLRETERAIIQAGELAEKLNSPMLMIASHREYMAVALRLRNELAENSKVYATAEELPEWFHNVVEGLDPTLWKILLIRGSKTSLYECYIRAVEETLGKVLDTFELKGVGFLGELLYGAFIGGLASIILASMKGLEPFETPRLRTYRTKANECVRRRTEEETKTPYGLCSSQ